jgi:L-threonylcarbamoyladenylate synthase
LKTQIVSCLSGPERRAAVRLAARALREGMPVALPTETVYGLAADALDPLACARIFEAKERPLSDPLIVHVPDIPWLDRIAQASGLAMRLVGAFWPGPLTLVLPRRAIVPDLVTAGQGTVAVRQSAHPVFREVLAEFGGPLAAPSANRFARISPTTAPHVLSELGGRVEWILDGGPCAHGIESTIALVSDAGVRRRRRSRSPGTRSRRRAWVCWRGVARRAASRPSRSFPKRGICARRRRIFTRRCGGLTSAD